MKNRKMMGVILLCAVPCLSSAHNYTLAQYPDPEKASVNADTINLSMKGQVVSVDAASNMIAVRDNLGSTKMFDVSRIPIVRQSGETVDVLNIKPGDSVILDMGTDNRVTRVTVFK